MKKTQKRLEEARDQIRHLTEMLSKSHKENAKLAKKLRKMRVELGSDSSDHVIGQLSSAESEIGKKIDERLRGLDSRTGVTKFELKLLDFIPDLYKCNCDFELRFFALGACPKLS